MQLAYIICGILVYGVIIIFDDAETIQSIGKHVSTEMVSEGHSSEGHSKNLVLFEQKVTSSGSKSILTIVRDSGLAQIMCAAHTSQINMTKCHTRCATPYFLHLS